jgi:RNA-splicing ligase RtcB
VADSDPSIDVVAISLTLVEERRRWAFGVVELTCCPYRPSILRGQVETRSSCRASRGSVDGHTRGSIMQKVNERLYNWATDIEQGTIDQALKTARLPIVSGHVALMPDAHVGFGSTVGSVIPTTDAIIPAAVGVDIGCGMIAVHTSLTAAQLPDSLDNYQPLVAKAVPAGLGKWHAEATDAARVWFAANPPRETLPDSLRNRALNQFGTLGSGNHFFEVCLDENDDVFLVLHSGSRGVGNQLATMHIDVAKDLADQLVERLEDPDLAYLLEGTPEFAAYIGDLLWSQAYAAANRDQMMNAALAAFLAWVGTGAERSRVNCHHNYTARETHNGVETWITRKGAIRAGTGDLGVIPGSMGTASYIVAGLGKPESYESCSHGAGRRLSRGQARRFLTPASLTEAMGDRSWQDRNADDLVDEHPAAYKDIDQVMADQADLVKVVHTLRQVLNYKGTDEGHRKRRHRQG